MTSILEKADYVKSAKQLRHHTCHWPRCDKQVPPALWGCYPHWRRLPLVIRIAIWNSYKLGQEIKLNPSKAYIEAAKRAQKWILEHSVDFKKGKSIEKAR